MVIVILKTKVRLEAGKTSLRYLLAEETRQINEQNILGPN